MMTAGANEGEVEAYGSHAELLSGGLDPSKLLGLKNENDARTDEFVIRQEIDSDTEVGDSAAHLSSTYRTRLVPVTTSLETLSVYSAGSVVSLHFNCETEESLPDSEDKDHRKVSVKTYFRFFRAGGNYLLLLAVFLIFIAAQGSTITADWWLTDWADCDRNNNGTRRSTCRLFTTERILVYAGITAFTIILNLARTVCFYIICINASRLLHNRMFASVLRAPVRFFDTNPIGRVLNRFSKDQGFLDDLIPYLMCEALLWMTYFVGVVLTTVVSNVWMLIALVVLCTVVLPLRWYYLKTSREVKRLESVARSPLYSHISTTIHGLTTIRAFGKQRVALSLFHKYHNEHTQGWWLFKLSEVWFTIRIATVVAAFVAVVAFSSVRLSSSLNPTLIGLSLVYILTLAKYVKYTLVVGAQAENLMVSAERVMEYGQLQSEPPLETVPSDKKPPPNWPDKGGIEVDEVSFRYADDLPLVLKSLSFSVNPSQKIGVVGRTGAGKSSLLSVLFRMAEYFGIVTIDGVNVKEIGLHDLRSRMSIIPQDPVLFSGTVRYNLDPFDEYSDQELWTVLEQVQLMLTVQDLDGHLHAEVSEGGANFSVGQRQLVCLARALLRKNKILVLDEATANVDMQTDDILQATLREHFSECTVLTIAHRLNTVMDSDKILVMSKGQVKEFDNPYILLHNPRSHFRKMVELTGPSASKKLRQMAAEAHLRRHNTAYSTPTCQLASTKNEPWVMNTPL